MEKYVIDRFEGDFAVCESTLSGDMINIEIEELPDDVIEGDVIYFEDGIYIKDEFAEKEVEERMIDRMDNLWN